MNRQNILLVVSASLATALVMLGVPALGQLVQTDSQPAATTQAQPEPSPQVERYAPTSQAGLQQSFAPIVQRTAPAVVNVYSSVNVRRTNCPYRSGVGRRLLPQRPDAQREGRQLARLGRHRRLGRRHRHQQPRRGRRRRLPRRPVGSPRIPGDARHVGCPHRSRRPQDRHQGRSASDARLCRYARRAGRRPRHRHRQPVRRRADCHQRHRLGAGAHRRRRLRLSRPSSRPTPRSTPATPAARWSTCAAGWSA